jgi:hypothetical protein
MDNQDKLFEQIKLASLKEETKDFPAMDKVWSRVAEKLDAKEDKKTIGLWKKIAVAASLLLVLSLGFQFLKSEEKTPITSPKVVTTDINAIPNAAPLVENNSIALAEEGKIISEKQAVRILKNQIEKEEVVVANETMRSDTLMENNSAAPLAITDVMGSGDGYFEKQEEQESGAAAVSKARVAYSTAMGYSKSKQYDGESNRKEMQVLQKTTPLIVMNGQALADKDTAKKDQLIQQQLSNLDPKNIESIIILEAPLYIINGVYYSENDLFSPTPTSPYAPLNKQEIKTITVLQGEEATATYGEKGKKGVVIIFTKTGKPVAPK